MSLDLRGLRPDTGDPKNCWLCGEKGVPGVGSRMQCVECEVTWMPYGR